MTSGLTKSNKMEPTTVDIIIMEAEANRERLAPDIPHMLQQNIDKINAPNVSEENIDDNSNEELEEENNFDKIKTPNLSFPPETQKPGRSPESKTSLTKLGVSEQDTHVAQDGGM